MPILYIFEEIINQMPKAVISGDIIASTSLTNTGRMHVYEKLSSLVRTLGDKYGMYGRIIKGDYIECIPDRADLSLRLALVIKCYVKSLSADMDESDDADPRRKFFRMHGIRLAIGFGEISRFEPDEGIIDGEAIYLSGRRLNEEFTYNKERIIIKNTLFFVSSDNELNKEFEPLFALVDVLISKATPRQCEVLYMKLMDLNEEAIAARLHIAQPVVNQHSTSVGWNAIEKAVNRFSEVIRKKVAL
jgi:hypothetical protein